MIDLSQWRASIGLWNCSRGCSIHSFDVLKSFKGTHVQSDYYKTTVGPYTNQPLPLSTNNDSGDESHTKGIDESINVDEKIQQNTCNNNVIHDTTNDKWVQPLTTLLHWCSPFLYLIFSLSFLLFLSGDVELNPGPGDSREVFRTNCAKLTNFIAPNLMRVTNELYSKGLIQKGTVDEMLVMGVIPDYTKTMKLMMDLERLICSSPDPNQYFIAICQVLINQQHQRLTDIVTSLLRQLLGQSILATTAPPISTVPTDVQHYSDIIRDQYKHQPIVGIDWPPRVGKDFFGRVALIEAGDSNLSWHMLRGRIDEILSGNTEIAIKDILQPCDPPFPLRVIIDGPPGIGKTTLCRKLCNMWANRTLTHQQYDLVLYCPLRNSKIAQATTLADLCMYNSPNKVSKVVQWMIDTEGEGLLIIFDGWDELSTKHRHSSIAASIIRRHLLAKSSVIAMSRSYASSSLLDLDSFSKHVQVIGFTEEEIATVIQGTLENKDTQLAENLISDLKARSDVQSLCYIPLVCSMVILVYCKMKGHLPTTLTELYENFILQTIRRHVKKTHNSIDPKHLHSLDDLPPVLATSLHEMCEFAYINLKETKMTFYSHQLQQSLNESIKENYLGLMTSFPEYDDEMYQFLHLSIQEFLGAWYIAKNTMAEEVFKELFDDDHFRMCLRFVAGLTHLKPEEKFQHFFGKSLDLQCKRVLLSELETYHKSLFYQNSEVKQDDIFSKLLGNHFNRRDDFPFLFFQLLYESQNAFLCKVLAESNNRILCLQGLGKENSWLSSTNTSMFDWLCLSYFINNVKLDYLDLGQISDRQTASVFTRELILQENQNMCKSLEVYMPNTLVHTILQPFYFIQECRCAVSSSMWLEFINLPQVRILHLRTFYNIEKENDDNYLVNIEKRLEKNCALQEVKFEITLKESKLASNLIKGIARNKYISSFTLSIISLNNEDDKGHDITLDLKYLLKNNHILKALSLNIPDRPLKNIEVNTPLVALKLENRSMYRHSTRYLVTTLLPQIRHLQCLTLQDEENGLEKIRGHIPPPYYTLHLLFTSNPSLQSLSYRPLHSAGRAIELFTILQTNTTLKGLKVTINEEKVFTDNMSYNLQEMLRCNQTLHYLDISCIRVTTISISFLYFLTTGLIANTTLKQLSVPIPLVQSAIKQVNTFFNVISQKSNLTDLQMDFRLGYDKLCSTCSFPAKPQLSLFHKSCTNCNINTMEEKVTPLFFEEVLPAISNMLQSHANMRFLKIDCRQLSDKLFKSIWTKIVQDFYRIIFSHSLVQYIEIQSSNSLFRDVYSEQKMTLIALHKKHQPQKPLPLVNMT